MDISRLERSLVYSIAQYISVCGISLALVRPHDARGAVNSFTLH